MLFQECNPRVVLWHQACPYQGHSLLQLQPGERWSVRVGVWTWGRMAALHIHLSTQLPSLALVWLA